MEGTILKAERAVEAAQAATTDPSVMEDHVKLNEAFHRLSEAQHTVERLYARWAELEGKRA